MNYSHKFYRAIGVDPDEKGDDTEFARKAGLPVSRLRYYNDQNILPSGEDLEAICAEANITPLQLKLQMGHIDGDVRRAISEHSEEVSQIISDNDEASDAPERPNLFYQTDLGKLYKGDCLNLMENMDSESVDMIFADPPFNLDKDYPSGINDNLKEEEYLMWCKEWLSESVRILRQGGSLFVWNLPKWNTYISGFLNKRLNFRHWVAVDIKYRLPIRGRLYPSHYSLLYYCKGERPNTFDPDRLPLETCRHCYKDIKDYGGYKSKMNPKGVNLTDVWYDIPPVRHSKYKNRSKGNELSIKIMDRIIEMSTEEGDVVFDPFGGAGTTYAVSEMKKRNWIGVEIGPVDVIKERIEDTDDEEEYLSEIRSNLNNLFPKEVKKKRKERGIWTDDKYHSDEDDGELDDSNDDSTQSSGESEAEQAELDL